MRDNIREVSNKKRMNRRTATDKPASTTAAVAPPLPNSYWVVPGRLAAGEHPFGQSPADAQDRLARLRAAGIDTFLDLTEIDEMPNYRVLLPRRTQYWRRSVPDCAVPEEFAQMRDIQRLIQSALAQERKLYVHCRAGIGRTGTVIGCFLVEQGREGDFALKELNVLWRQSERSSSWPTVPQTQTQANYILNWAQCRHEPMTEPAPPP
jgi:hypothetical protein